MKKRFGISAGILAGALFLSAAPAMARVNVDVHLGVPAPVYVAPRPVYVAPPRPVYVRPVPVYAHPYRHHYHKRHYGHPRRDFDHDGVPNRYDRRPDNPYRY